MMRVMYQAANVTKAWWSFLQWYQSQVQLIKRDLPWRRKRRRKKRDVEKIWREKMKPEKEETLNSSKHFKPRRQSKTKKYSILKIFEVDGVAVEVEEMITVVEVVVKKGIWGEWAIKPIK
jgi:hypothetical protein